MLPEIKGRVVVIGDYMVDIIVKPDGPMVHGSDQKAEIISTPGGSAANQAAWLAHFNVPVALIARVGADDSDGIAQQLLAQDVTPFLQADEENPTGRLVTLLDAEGERSFFTDRGANPHLRFDALPRDWLHGAGLLVVSGYALFDPRQRAEVLKMMGAARDKNVAIALDPGSTGFLEQVGVQNFLDWTQGIDLAFPNAAEACLMAESDDLEMQMKHLGAFYDLVIIKTWPAGSAAGTVGGVVLNRPVTPLEPVDSTGAGDAFLAGFIAELLAGDDLGACMDAGNKAGGIAVQQIGGRPSAKLSA